VDERGAVLVEAYWKLRDHAESLRDTRAYRLNRERAEDPDRSDELRALASRRLTNLESRIRGIEDGARDLAELLGIEECDNQRPSGLVEENTDD